MALDKQTAKKNKKYKVGIVIAHNFDLYDHMSPFVVFDLFPEYFELKIVTVNKDLKPVKNYHPGYVTPDCTIYDDESKELDILVVGWHDPYVLVDYPDFRKWLANIQPSVTYFVSVCAGVSIYADMGWLNHRRATFTKGFFALAYLWAPRAIWIPNQRWTNDKNYWTASGVTAGIDCTAHFIAQEIIGKNNNSTAKENKSTIMKDTLALIEQKMGLFLAKDATYDPYATHVPWIVQKLMPLLRPIILPIFTWVIRKITPTWDAEHSIFTLLTRDPLTIRNQDPSLRRLGPTEKRKALVLTYNGMDLLSFSTLLHHVGFLWEFSPILMNASTGAANKTCRTRQGVEITAEYSSVADLESKKPYDWLIVPGGEIIPKEDNDNNTLVVLEKVVERILQQGGFEYVYLPDFLTSSSVAGLVQKKSRLVLTKTNQPIGFRQDNASFKIAADTLVGPKLSKEILEETMEVLPENLVMDQHEENNKIRM